jgi:MFS family permease
VSSLPIKNEHELIKEQSRKYILYLVIFIAMVALMDQYLSFIETTSIPYVLKEYSVTDVEYSWWKTIYFIPTVFVFLLSGLNDIIGRKKTMLILILLLGLASLGIVYVTPSFHMFMFFFAIITFAAVSNLWTIPINEEVPAERRAKMVSIVYVISLIPLQAIIPPLLNRFGLSWKWMYGVMFLFMIPVLVMWVFMKETKRFDIIKVERELGLRKYHYFGFGVIDRRDLKYIVFSAIIWMCGLIVSMLLVWAGHFFRDIHGFTLDQWSMILFFGLLFMMAGAVIGGLAMDRIGRKNVLIISSIGLGFFMSLIGIVPLMISFIVMIVSAFFIGFSYTWVIVYIPEIFPTERRGACMGWTTSLARISYIVGPALAAILLMISPTMELFWIVAGIISVIPIVLVLFFHPYETKRQELETIESKR